MRIISLLVKSLAILVSITGAAPVIATDGRLEINQVCAAGPGCFNGDAPGFPVTVTTPGSYVLTGNLSQSAPDVPVIDLGTTDNVSVDLNGFSISGTTVCTEVLSPPNSSLNCTPGNTGSGHGIIGQGRNILISGGSISGLGSFGILLANNSSSEITGMLVRSNAGSGIRADINAVISSNVVELNGGEGIGAGVSTVTNNVVRKNKFNGLQLGEGTLAQGNIVSRNHGMGIYCADNCIVQNNVVHGNEDHGIYFASGGIVKNNNIQGNWGYGLHPGWSGCSPSNAVVGYSQNLIRTSAGQLGTVAATCGVEMGQNICNSNTTCP